MSNLTRRAFLSCGYCTTLYVLSDVQVRCPSCGAPPRQHPTTLTPLSTTDVDEAATFEVLYGTRIIRAEMGAKVA
jgi:hypothetical protein